MAADFRISPGDLPGIRCLLSQQSVLTIYIAFFRTGFINPIGPQAGM
jgi:hypothetical protein